MTKAEEKLEEFQNGQFAKDVERGSFFGFSSLKHRGKSFVILSEEDLVFRLDEALSEKALNFAGSQRWNPYGREKRTWIQVPVTQAEHWDNLFREALSLIRKTQAET